MSKKLYTILALVLLASMALTACAPAATPTAAPVVPTEAPAQPVVAPTTAPVAAATAVPQATVAPTAAASGSKFKVGLVTDTGGVNDKSFNQSAWEGVQKAMTGLGIQGKFIESKQPTDYDKNIDQFATEG
jgi:basic membrane protein A